MVMRENMVENMRTTIGDVVSRIPEWVRRKLLSADPLTRARAEETIAAMIQDALGNAAG